MIAWAFLAGGFVGALVMAIALEAAGQARLTRLDIPLVLGTVFHRSRAQARAAGYTAHVGMGIGFAAGYDLLGAEGWGRGAVMGLVHGVLAAALLYPLLPFVHPRMSFGDRDGARLEAPGFLMRRYGVWTPPILVATHVAYGCLVGGFAALGA